MNPSHHTYVAWATDAEGNPRWMPIPPGFGTFEEIEKRVRQSVPPGWTFDRLEEVSATGGIGPIMEVLGTLTAEEQASIASLGHLADARSVVGALAVILEDRKAPYRTPAIRGMGDDVGCVICKRTVDLMVSMRFGKRPASVLRLPCGHLTYKADSTPDAIGCGCPCSCPHNRKAGIGLTVDSPSLPVLLRVKGQSD